MKRFYFSACVVLVTCCAASFSHAAVTLLDDFGTYTVDASINGQSNGAVNWEANRNGNNIVDSGWSQVVERDGDKALRLVNRDSDNALDTVYTIMQLPSAATSGTIYLRWMQSDEGFVNSEAGVFPTPDGSSTVAATTPVPSDTLFTTNDLNFGFDPDGDGDASTGTPGNGLNNYTDQGSMVVMRSDSVANGGSQFRARDGGGYTDVDVDSQLGTTGVNMVHNQWYEMWLQEDHTLGQTRYYFAKDGETPQVVLDGTGSEWWGMRNQTYTNTTTSVLKMFAGSRTAETRVYVDTIGWDPDGYSTNGLADTDTAAGFAGDFDMDGDVDGNDFLVWQRDPNVGNLSDWQSEYGSGIPLSATLGVVPEPSSLILLGIAGSLGCVFRRRG